MSRRRNDLNGISHTGNSNLITRVRSTSWSVPVHPATIDNNFPQRPRPERRSEWTMVTIIFSNNSFQSIGIVCF